MTTAPSTRASTLGDSNSAFAEPAAKLKPKEHGAYAILGIPTLTALIVAGPTVAGICIVVAAFAGFLAHEPLLVKLGHRGARAQRTTPAATNRLIALLLLTTICGGIAFAIGSVDVRLALVVCGVLAATSFSVAIAGVHRSLSGQLWGVVVLSAVCIPVLLAGGIGRSQAAETWVSWLIGFTATTMAVRGVIASQKRQSRLLHLGTLIVLTSAVAGLTIGGFKLPIATLPMLAMSWYLQIAPPPAKQLKRVGWALVVGTLGTAVWMAITL